MSVLGLEIGLPNSETVQCAAERKRKISIRTLVLKCLGTSLDESPWRRKSHNDPSPMLCIREKVGLVALLLVSRRSVSMG